MAPREHPKLRARMRAPNERASARPGIGFGKTAVDTPRNGVACVICCFPIGSLQSRRATPNDLKLRHAIFEAYQRHLRIPLTGINTVPRLVRAAAANAFRSPRPQYRLFA